MTSDRCLLSNNFVFGSGNSAQLNRFLDFRRDRILLEDDRLVYGCLSERISNFFVNCADSRPASRINRDKNVALHSPRWAKRILNNPVRSIRVVSISNCEGVASYCSVAQGGVYNTASVLLKHWLTHVKSNSGRLRGNRRLNCGIASTHSNKRWRPCINKTRSERRLITRVREGGLPTPVWIGCLCNRCISKHVVPRIDRFAAETS